MTVDELIKELSGLPGNASVNVASDCCGCDLNHLHTVEFFEGNDKETAVVCISGSHEYAPIRFGSEPVDETAPPWERR